MRETCHVTMSEIGRALRKCPFSLKTGKSGPECRHKITHADGARGRMRSGLGAVWCGVLYVEDN